jgi:glutamate-1-semialdehyde 2,1-aminomutase/spore coat polysaccharide biosynthesis protein SpsF
MVTAVIVQARMGSSRLPGKVMCELGGVTVLERVLQRCGRIPGADLVICAMPEEPASDPLEKIATATGARAFRGAEQDVLSRYRGAAESVGAEVVMRITSDCPFVDPDVAGRVLEHRRRTRADYAANNLERTYPHGLDCEAFTSGALAEADRAASDPYDREHVTPWLRRAPHLKRANLRAREAGLAEQRWTLDYPEDLAFFRAVLAALPQGVDPSMADVLAVVAAHPEIATINAHRRVA